jgi:hypothetical protein
MGCRIPQMPGCKEPCNVIAGHFLNAKDTSWAVLCSNSGSSRILVFSKSSATPVASLCPAPDSSYMQGIVGVAMGFSRFITVADQGNIVAHNPSERPSHDGIDDGFEGKASHIHYLGSGQWRELTGAD